MNSPDRRIEVAVVLPDEGGAAAPRWSASFLGKPLLADCRLGFTVAGPIDVLAGSRATAVARRTHNERIVVLFGKASQARDHCEELRVSLRAPGALRVDAIWRCYDDAIAFRYEVAGDDGRAALQIVAEGTSFALAGEPTLLAQYLEGHRTSHEHEVASVPYAALPEGRLLDLPLTALWQDGRCVAISEAALRRYAGMSLRRVAGGRDLAAVLSPRDDGLAVERPLPMVTPWRVVLVGDRLGALLESNTLYCLNEPPKFDPSWIRPGKLTWPWWNGYLFESARTEPILSLAMSRRHIDFCADHGIAFHALVAAEDDSPWYHQPGKGLFPRPGTDATRVRDGFDLAEIRRHAEAKGVRLWTWVHHGAVRGRVDEVFAAFARLGWSGVMVDFLDRDDQDTLEFCEQVLDAAARHRVLVHFHGMAKPTGWQRTFPHLMNHEGALNLEYLKWSGRCTPEHDLRIAFTRLVAGPVDYHLGGFRAVSAADFRPKHVAPNVLGTRGHQLALYVCFDNPAPMVADYPAAYRDQPGFDFVCEVPTWWDETRVLQAEVGRLLVSARRRGDVWYLGGLGAGPPREVVVPLSFLAPGQHAVQVWQDGAETERNPNHVEVLRSEAGPADTLRVRVGSDGGFVARCAPRR